MLENKVQYKIFIVCGVYVNMFMNVWIAFKFCPPYITESWLGHWRASLDSNEISNFNYKEKLDLDKTLTRSVYLIK